MFLSYFLCVYVCVFFPFYILFSFFPFPSCLYKFDYLILRNHFHIFFFINTTRLFSLPLKIFVVKTNFYVILFKKEETNNQKVRTCILDNLIKMKKKKTIEFLYRGFKKKHFRIEYSKFFIIFIYF